MPIYFHNAEIRFSFKQKKVVKDFLEKQLSKQTKALRLDRLDYIFCSDEYLLNINRKFLKHDYYTDIITFPPLQNEGDPTFGGQGARAGVGGEIYISIERIKENAKQLSVEFEEELLRVIFHGVLHLLGHKDKTKAQKAAMRKLESRWLKKYEIAIKT